jgi:hypothetical protein
LSSSVSKTYWPVPVLKNEKSPGALDSIVL